MELKDIKRYEENKSIERKKRITHASVPAFRLESSVLGDLIGVFLARSLIVGYRVIAPNMELFYMKRRHLERLWGLIEKFLLEFRL